MLHLPEFVWTLRSSVLVVFNNFLLLDATNRSKISSDQKRFFYRIKPPFHFSRTLPLSVSILTQIKIEKTRGQNFCMEYQ